MMDDAATFILGIIIGAALWEAISSDDGTPPPDGDWLLVRPHVWDQVVAELSMWKRIAKRHKQLRRLV